jgi:hypothetical protein
MIHRLDVRLAGLVLVAMLLLSPPGAAGAQSLGILEGQVVVGTAGGPEVGAGIPVSLYVIQNDLQVDIGETVTDAEGRFRFEELDTDGTLEYWLGASYLGVEYGPSGPNQFSEGQTALQVTVTVYETAGDESGIVADLVILRIQSLGSLLRVQESYYLGNSADRTYQGQPGLLPDERLATVLIPLPEGQFGLGLGSEDGLEHAVEAEGGIAVTDAIQPGEATTVISFSYHLGMAEGETVRLERSLSYPMDAVWVLVAQPGLVLRSDELTSQGIVELEADLPEELFVAEDLPADSRIVMELEAMAGQSSPEVSGASTTGAESESDLPRRGHQEVLGLIGIGVVLLSVLGAVVYPLSARSPAIAPVRSPKLSAEPQVRRFLTELADLEEAHEAGEVDEATYERQRSETYGAIRSLWERETTRGRLD